MWTYSREKYAKGFRHCKKFKNRIEKEAHLKEELLHRFICPEGNKLELFNDEGVDIPPYACEFSPADLNDSKSLCLIADEEGYVILVDTNTAPQHHTTKVVSKWRCHKNAILDIAWGREKKFATASGDTTAVLWDVNCPDKSLNVFSGHSCSVKSICFSKFQPSLLATGSRDGNALIWDDRCKNGPQQQPSIRIQDAHAVYDALTPQKKRRRKLASVGSSQLLKDSRQTVTSVLFQTDNTLITSGAMDGTIKLWDLRKIKLSKQGKSGYAVCPTPKESIGYPGSSTRRRGYTCLLLDTTHTKLFASCTDDTVYEYNLLQNSVGYGKVPTHRYTGHYSSSFDVKIKLSPDDAFLLSGSDSEKAYIWNTKTKSTAVTPTACLASDSRMEQVTSVDWCPSDWSQIVTCSDDCAVRFWRLSGESPAPACFEGNCQKLALENNSQVKTEKKAELAKVNVTPIKSPLPRSPDLSMLTPRQTSLCKWVQQRYSPWQSDSSCDSPIDSDKENAPVRVLSSRKRIFETRRTLISNSTNSPPAKVEFRSQKPVERKENNSKRLMTMEDYFLR